MNKIIIDYKCIFWYYVYEFIEEENKVYVMGLVIVRFGINFGLSSSLNLGDKRWDRLQRKVVFKKGELF